MKYYKVSVKHHRPGQWVKPEKHPMYGLFKVLTTGTIRVRPSRQYTKEESMWRFATYLKRPEYFLDIVEMSETQVKPEPWEDTNLT